MKEKTELIFNMLQELDLKPTPRNVSRLNEIYVLLSELYKKMEELENGKKECSTNNPA